MSGPIESTWEDTEKAAHVVAEEAKRISNCAAKMVSSTKEGLPTAAARAVHQLDESVASLIESLQHVRAGLESLEQQLGESGALASEIERTLRLADPEARVWKGFNQVVRYPVTISFRGKGLGTKLTVDKEAGGWCRPSVVATLVGRSVDPRASERFARSLHGAFKVLNNGRETGTAPVTALQRVLGTLPPDADAYTVHDFSVDLQHLRASGMNSVSNEIQFSFQVAAAGPTAIPLIELSGDIVNVGYIKFEVAELGL